MEPDMSSRPLRQLVTCTSIAFAVLATGASAAETTSVYENFLPGTPFSFEGSRSVQGSDVFGGENAPAYTFVSSVTAKVTQLEFGLFLEGTTTLNATLWTAGAGCGTGAFTWFCEGPVPLDMLGRWDISAAPGMVATVTNVSGVTVTAGKAYYLQLSPNTPDSQAFWFGNTTGAQADLWQCAGSTPDYAACVGYASIGTTDAGAFRVQGIVATVPEPSHSALLLAGLALLGLRCRYRSQPLLNVRRPANS